MKNIGQKLVNKTSLKVFGNLNMSFHLKTYEFKAVARLRYRRTQGTDNISSDK